MKTKNAILYFKQHGILSFLNRAVTSLGFEFFTHAVVFIVLDLNEMSNDIKEPCSFREVTIVDVQQAKDYNDGWFTKDEAIQRLQNGRRLFILEKDGRYIYSHWVETKKVTIHWLNLNFFLPEDIVYTAGLYIIPEMRGQGLALRMCKELSLFLKDQGFNKQIGAIITSNTTSLHLNKKIGFKEYQIITYKRYGYVNHYIVKKSNSDKRKTYITLFKAPKDIWKTFL